MLSASSGDGNFPLYNGNVKWKTVPVAGFDNLFVHRVTPVSTGCAQRGNGFGLQERQVRVQSLST